jgi:hypothetical protein
MEQAAVLGQGHGMKLKNISKTSFHKSGIVTKLAYHRQGIGSTFRRHDSFDNLKGVVYGWSRGVTKATNQI